jgi:outer membrane murein-binding lipoprotein Lpp
MIQLEGGGVMKRGILLLVCLLITTTGCVSRQSVQSMIDEHHATAMNPVNAMLDSQQIKMSALSKQLEETELELAEANERMDQMAAKIGKNKKQIKISKIRIDENTYKISEYSEGMSLQKNLMLKTFEQQKQQAEDAIHMLKPTVEDEEELEEEPADESVEKRVYKILEQIQRKQ